MNKENEIKGGVILIGSLFWENGSNAIDNSNSRKLGKKRNHWRNQFLDNDQKQVVPLPIRYGRCSSTRYCTYSMVFSRSALEKSGNGIILPFKSEIDFSKYYQFETHVIKLANVEGISKDDNRLRKSWGCIGIYLNKDSKHFPLLNKHWINLRRVDSEYAIKNSRAYRINADDENRSLLDDNYVMRDEIKIEGDFDFLLFTYVKPKHRNPALKRYPLPEEIADEIIKSGYRTYFEENRKNGIETFQDLEILKFLEEKR